MKILKMDCALAAKDRGDTVLIPVVFNKVVAYQRV